MRLRTLISEIVTYEDYNLPFQEKVMEKQRNEVRGADIHKKFRIMHHLLVNKEKYQENGNIKSNHFNFDRTSSPIEITEEDKINTLVNAGYIIKKKMPMGAYNTNVFRVIKVLI